MIVVFIVSFLIILNYVSSEIEGINDPLHNPNLIGSISPETAFVVFCIMGFVYYLLFHVSSGGVGVE